MKKMFAIVLALMLCVSVLSVAAFAAGDTITIHVKIDSETAPNAWAWGASGDVFAAEGWPGKAMTKNGDWWEITVPAGTTGFIANNGTAQTGDITIPGDADAWIEVAADFSSFEIVSAPNGGGNEDDKKEDDKKEDEKVETDVTYYVAGSDALGGWELKNDANKMTKGSDGIYTKVYNNVPAGEHKFKVNDGTWTNAWPAEDYVINVSGTATVTIKFNPATGEVTVDVDAKGGDNKGDNNSNKTFYVAGCEALTGANWDVAGIKMTKGSDGIYTYTFKNVAKGNYSLKVTQGDWNKQSWGHTGENGNFDFEVAEAGDVLVKFDTSKGLVTLVIGGKSIEGTASPITGDVSLVGVSVALLAATAGLVAVVSLKKKEEI